MASLKKSVPRKLSTFGAKLGQQKTAKKPSTNSTLTDRVRSLENRVKELETKIKMLEGKERNDL
jgi:hypothetical protein